MKDFIDYNVVKDFLLWILSVGSHIFPNCKIIIISFCTKAVFIGISTTKHRQQTDFSQLSSKSFIQIQIRKIKIFNLIKMENVFLTDNTKLCKETQTMSFCLRLMEITIPLYLICHTIRRRRRRTGC